MEEKKYQDSSLLKAHYEKKKGLQKFQRKQDIHTEA